MAEKEYIEREAACVDCIHAGVCDQSSRQVWGRMVGETECTDFKSTAEVVEVRHGRWIKITSYPMGCKCSECGYLKQYKKPYCEICGAKMDGKGE